MKASIKFVALLVALIGLTAVQASPVPEAADDKRDTDFLFQCRRDADSKRGYIC
ncbi:hypothetical protein V5O48_011681 [Marasmius crinis-equi]|uniref:Uncharacterized protein n=1 Tax=Marasmius crinis-equi TaxID=585013 RepID=A0ABR3F4X4_9AGAR